MSPEPARWVVGLIRDLIFIPKVRSWVEAQGAAYANARTPQELFQKIADNRPELVVLDLQYQAGDLMEIIRTLAALEQVPRTVGYYPHVDDELAQRALSAGVQSVVPRSKLERAVRDALTHRSTSGTGGA